MGFLMGSLHQEAQEMCTLEESKGDASLWESEQLCLGVVRYTPFRIRMYFHFCENESKPFCFPQILHDTSLLINYAIITIAE
jgi:hypothetical protein